MTPLDYILTLTIIFAILATIIWVSKILGEYWTRSLSKPTPVPPPGTNGSNGQAKQDAQAFQTLVARLAGDNLREKERRRELEDEIRELSRQLSEARKEIERLNKKLEAFIGT